MGFEIVKKGDTYLIWNTIIDDFTDSFNDCKSLVEYMTRDIKPLSLKQEAIKNWQKACKKPQDFDSFIQGLRTISVKDIMKYGERVGTTMPKTSYRGLKKSEDSVFALNRAVVPLVNIRELIDKIKTEIRKAYSEFKGQTSSNEKERLFSLLQKIAEKNSTILHECNYFISVWKKEFNISDKYLEELRRQR